MSTESARMFSDETSQTSNPNQGEEIPQDLDLNSVIEVDDVEADSNIAARPPEGGKVYPFKWSLNPNKSCKPIQGEEIPKGVIIKLDKNKNTLLETYLIGELISDDEFNGFQVNDYRNTSVFRGKPTSEVHSFLAKLSSPVSSNRISVLELARHIEKVLAENPIGMAELEWRASYQDPTDPKANKDGYVTLHNKMAQFPQELDEDGKWTGRYQNFEKSPKDGEPVYAQAYISKHVSQ